MSRIRVKDTHYAMRARGLIGEVVHQFPGIIIARLDGLAPNGNGPGRDEWALPDGHYETLETATPRVGLSETIPGCSPIQSTDPCVMAAIFKCVPIYPDDVLVDVGCGDGDIIAHWLDMGLRNKIIGLELDCPTALATAARFVSSPTVKIIDRDASRGDPDGTLFYLFNPFRGEQMRRFEQSLRDRPARVIYNAYHDLEIFDGWKIEKLIPEPDEYQFRAAVLSSPCMCAAQT